MRGAGGRGLAGEQQVNIVFTLDPILSIALAAFATLLDIAAISQAMLRRRGFAGTLTWIFAILALPAVGAVAYFLLAEPRVSRTRRSKIRAKSKVNDSNINVFSSRLCADAIGAVSSPMKSILSLCSRLTGLTPTCGNKLELLTDNHIAFEYIEKELLNAKKRIWAEYYIIENDGTGRRFLELLAKRASEGIEVKLLYDAVGSAGIDGALISAIERAGGRTAAFLPVNPLRRRWAVHLRNHRKILLIDGRHAFTGGMNVGDRYSGKRGFGRFRRRAKGFAFRDTHLSIRGPAAQDLALVFAEDWCFATDELLEAPPGGPAQAGAAVAVLPSGPDQESNATSHVYFAAVTMSQRYCYLTSPYFVPDEPMLRALSNAALRGVDVRLIVPSKSDVALIKYAIRSYYPQLIRDGIRIYEYQPSILHAKTMVVDSELGMVGSANLDIRSFRLNFEVSALVFDKEFAAVLEGQFQNDLAASREVSALDLARRGVLSAFLEGAAQLLSPLL